MTEVRLVDLEVIKRFSLALRQEFADAEDVLDALDASREVVMDALGDGAPPRVLVTRASGSARPAPLTASRQPAKKTARKTTARKTTARKTATRRAPAKKAASRTTAKKKTTAKKTAARKTTARRAAPARKPAKKAAAKRTTRTTAKKAVKRRR